MSHAFRVVLIHIGHSNRIRRNLNVTHLIRAVVLRDQRAAVGNVIEKPLVIRPEIVTHGISTHTQYDDGKLRKVCSRNVLRGKHRHIDSELP